MKIIKQFEAEFGLHHFEIEVRFETASENRYNPGENIIFLGEIDEYTIIHERLHAEIYCRKYLEVHEKDAFYDQLQDIARTRGAIESPYLDPLMNYFQDYSVNTFLSQRRNLTTLQLNTMTYLANLSEAVREGVGKVRESLNLEGGGISERIGELFLKISVVIGLINYDEVLGKESEYTIQLKTMDKECEHIYCLFKVFFSKFKGKLVNRKDYCTLLRFIETILDKLMS